MLVALALRRVTVSLLVHLQPERGAMEVCEEVLCLELFEIGPDLD